MIKGIKNRQCQRLRQQAHDYSTCLPHDTQGKCLYAIDAHHAALNAINMITHLIIFRPIEETIAPLSWAC